MRLILLIVMFSGLLWATGCATDTESNMPWATPQPWEGTPGIPGFSAPGR
jgi:hypothetical protein